MVVANDQPRGYPFLETPELLAHTLAERLQRLEAVARQGRVDADALAGAMIDGDKDAHLAHRGRHGRGHIVPHISFGRSVMMIPSWALGPWGWPTRCGAW